MSPHFILCVCWGRKRMSKGEVVRVWKRRWGNGGGESSIESVKDWERELRRIGENPEQDGGRRGQTPGARRLFSPNWQQARAPAEEKCVYPVTQIPLCLCTLCVCGTPAEECDLAHNGYDWSWSPLAPGWMTMQSQKPEQCHIHPLNTSYCISYWNKTKKKRKECSKGYGHDSLCRLDSHFSVCNIGEEGACNVYKVHTCLTDHLWRQEFSICTKYWSSAAELSQV